MIIQCDFDGTITLNNISVLLREKFAPVEWSEVEGEYLQRRLTVEQSNQRQYALIKTPKEALVEYACQKVEFRPGFLPFVEHCREAGTRFVIVSSGLDFYIEATLRKIGAPDLEVYCARTSFSPNGIKVTYSDPHGNPIKEGFKKSYLNWLKNQDSPIIYVGDGLSDLDAACAADYVFATDHLRRLLSMNTVPHYIFSDFNDIWEQINQL